MSTECVLIVVSIADEQSDCAACLESLLQAMAASISGLIESDSEEVVESS